MLAFTRVRRCISSLKTPPRSSLLLSTHTDAPPPVSTRHRHVKARLDFKQLVTNVHSAIRNGQNRASDGDPVRVVALYTQETSLRQSVNRLRARRNAHAKELGQLQSKQQKQLQPREEDAMMTRWRLQGRKLSREIADVEKELTRVSQALEAEALKLPNETHPDVPIGSQDKARLVARHGQKPMFTFQAKDHYDLAVQLELLDTETAARVAGSKFTYLCNEGAMMEIALVHWTLSKLRARGFKVMLPPDVAHYQLVEGCGYQPRGDATQIYALADSDLCLTGTSEITLAAMKSNEVMDSRTLPLKYAGFSHCFRTEIGHGGRQTRGIYRIHQFSKVEMFAFCANETQAQTFFDEMVEFQVSMYTELGLHFELRDMATEDLGAPAYRKFDVLAWMPGRQEYGEVSSLSMCTDFQARRLNIRHKDLKDKKARSAFVHTLNGTACAVPRLLISLWETYQQEDGSIVIPEVLRPYMGGQEIIRSPV